MKLLFIGDKVIQTHVSIIPTRTECDKVLEVGKVTNTTATLTDGRRTFKVYRDISGGVKEYPRDRRAFRTSWYEYKTSEL